MRCAILTFAPDYAAETSRGGLRSFLPRHADKWQKLQNLQILRLQS